MADHSGILGIIFNEKDPDKLSLLLHRNPGIIDSMTDYVAETTYSFFGIRGREEDQEWFYAEAYRRNRTAIRSITLLLRENIRDELDF